MRLMGEHNVMDEHRHEKLQHDTIRILAKHYNSQNLNREQLTDSLHKTYKKEFDNDPDNCYDVLVPGSSDYIKDDPITKYKNEYWINYKWPEETAAEPYPEFEGKPIEDAEIAKGQIIDRIGPPYGKYISPVMGNGSIYSVAERAIPYWFIAKELENEPSYHRYRVLDTINRDTIIHAIEASRELEPNEKAFFLNEVNKKPILYGGVAPVVGFGIQGEGHGLQYRLSLPIQVLLDIQLIEVLP